MRSGECLDVHHFAVLIGVGATTVNAYVAEGAIEDRRRRGLFGDLSLDACLENYRAAVDQGLLAGVEGALARRVAERCVQAVVRLVRDDDIVGGAMQSVRLVEGVLRAPGQLHVGGGNGLLVGIEPGFSGNKGKRLLPRPVLDGRHVCSAGEEEIFIEIRVSEIHPIELAVEFSQILAQREVPQRAIVEPLVARLKVAAGGQREGRRRKQQDGSQSDPFPHGRIDRL